MDGKSGRPEDPGCFSLPPIGRWIRTERSLGVPGVFFLAQLRRKAVTDPLEPKK